MKAFFVALALVLFASPALADEKVTAQFQGKWDTGKDEKRCDAETVLKVTDKVDRVKKMDMTAEGLFVHGISQKRISALGKQGPILKFHIYMQYTGKKRISYFMYLSLDVPVALLEYEEVNLKDHSKRCTVTFLNHYQ